MIVENWNVISPNISVVIPSYNSEKHIRKCIQSVLLQGTELPFEVILVDSSKDRTDQIVATEFPQVQLLHLDERCAAGTARNIGVKQARGDVILFLDTDCIASATWIDQIYTGIYKLGADGVGGSLENGTPWSITGCLGFYLEFFRVLAHSGNPHATPFFVTANCGYRRDVFKTTRYIDGPVSEDWILNWQLIEQGKKLIFLPSVTVKHLNKTGLLTVLRHQHKLGLGAYEYRSLTSPKIMHILKGLPVLTFLMPVGILPWIAATVLKRRGVLEFLKFVLLLPLLVVGNSVWAAGFHRALVNQKNRTKYDKL